MKNILIISRKELTAYFYSPIAYVVITIFLFISRYFFYNIVSVYAMISFNAMRDPYFAQGLNFSEGIFMPLFGNINIIMLLMIALLTMRLLAEEKKSGTLPIIN